MKKNNHPNWRGGQPKCKCGDIIGYTSKQCQKCYLETIKGKNHPNYKIGTKKCENCEKDLKKYDHKRCWKCYCLWVQNPKNNPSYINGLSKYPYSIKWTEILKEQIRKRDHYRCTICHKFGKDVHHIDYNKKNCKEDNLITLCHKHHLKTNFDRDYWYAYFTYVMKNSKNKSIT
jgi:hypothetical protein